MNEEFYWRARIMYPTFIVVYCDRYGYQINDTPPEGSIIKENYTDEELISWIRNQRNDLLLESDWTQLLDSPLSQEKSNEWKIYRQQLRDFPQTFDIINWENNSWPLKPSE